MTDKFYLVPAEWFEKAKAAGSMDKINLVDELLKTDLTEHGGSSIPPGTSGTTRDRGIIDWSKAPAGTTHCFNWADQEQESMPDESCFWERWDNDIVYEWDGGEGHWSRLCDLSDLDEQSRANRVKRP